MYKASHPHKSIKLNQTIYIQQIDGRFKVITYKPNEAGDIVKKVKGYSETLPPTGAIIFSPMEYLIAKEHLLHTINLDE